MAVLDQLDRIPVDRITAEAREVDFVRTLLAVLGGLLYGLGWLAAKAFMLAVWLLGRVFGALWLAAAWAGTAVKLGWADARRQPAGGLRRGTG